MGFAASYTNGQSWLGGNSLLDAFELNGYDPFSWGRNTLGLIYRFTTSMNGGPEEINVGGLVEAGNLWNQRSDVSLGDLHTSLSVFLGADSFLGPIYLGYAVGDDGQTAAFLYVGQLF